MKKVLMIIGGIFIFVIVLVVVLIAITSLNSKKLVCKSKEGNITIMYNEKTITGYTASGLSYDLDGQQAYAERIGVEQYLTEFSNWFSSNTSGSCIR